MTQFPPEDISGFLQLNAGDWLSLRSLLDPEMAVAMLGPSQSARKNSDLSQPWHESERAELHVAFLEPETETGCGGLEIQKTDHSKVRLIFHRGGTVAINALLGQWHLGEDGSLELAVLDDQRSLKERIWFRKPNLRLRCTLEQFADGQPGRASFSSEIRRVRRPEESTLNPSS